MRPFLLMAFAAAFALPATAQSPRVGVGLRAGLDLPSVGVTWNASPRTTLRAEGFLDTSVEYPPQYDWAGPDRASTEVHVGPRTETATRGLGAGVQFNLLPGAPARGYLGLSGRYLSRVTWYHNTPVCYQACVREPWFWPIGSLRVGSSHVRLGATAGAEVPVWRGLHVSGELGYFGAVLPVSGDMEWMFDNRATATFGLAYFVR